MPPRSDERIGKTKRGWGRPDHPARTGAQDTRYSNMDAGVPDGSGPESQGECTGKDPNNRNICISPTRPPRDQVRQAMEVVAVCVQLASE